MKQSYKITSLLAVFVFTGLAFLVISTEAQFNITVVRDSAFGERMRPAVPFYHEEHNAAAGLYDCTVCHHVWEDGEKLAYEDSVGMECSSCHYTQDHTEMDLIRAYHLQCRGCHMEEKAGPVLCAECHVGEK
jgi:hypothetical protein